MANETSHSRDEGRAITRREFLGILWMGAFGAAIITFLDVLRRFFLPRRQKGQFGGEFEIGTIAEIPNINDQPKSYPEGRFWLVRSEQGLLALQGTCTHLDCLVNWDESQSKFLCPCHGSDFSLNGNCTQGPADRALDRFLIRIVTLDGQLLRETDLSGAPLPVDDLLANEELVDIIDSAFVVVNTGIKIRGTTNG